MLMKQLRAVAAGKRNTQGGNLIYLVSLNLKVAPLAGPDSSITASFKSPEIFRDETLWKTSFHQKKNLFLLSIKLFSQYISSGSGG